MATSLSTNKSSSPRSAGLDESKRAREAGNALIIGLIVVVVAIGAYLLLSSRKSEQPSNENNNGTSLQVPAPDNQNVNEMIVNEEGGAEVEVNVNAEVNTNSGNNNTDSAEVKTFTVTAQNFSFNPAEIRVKKGDTVRIVLNNQSGFHNWALDEFNVATRQVMGPSTETVEFIADKTGTFEYYCSVGTHRAIGMKGNLIVE